LQRAAREFLDKSSVVRGRRVTKRNEYCRAPSLMPSQIATPAFTVVISAHAERWPLVTID
jgi:hypothetical protein